MSKSKTPGNRAKLAWIKPRFAEGMGLEIIDKGGRGYIEYIPGEHAWRVVDAKGYLFIHCIWVVGKAKGKGCGTHLLQHCIADARQRKMKGVAVVASQSIWLPSPPLFEKHGFELVDRAPPKFELWALRFGRARKPKFPTSWDERCRRFGDGLTIVTTAQCPYNDDAVKGFHAHAEKHGLDSRVVSLETRAEMMDRSPSAYGAFGVVLDGRLFTYHYMVEREFDKRLQTFRSE
jgi:GNAT superfamily N-acetyltransferase